jgi:hypothetical protein
MSKRGNKTSRRERLQGTVTSARPTQTSPRNFRADELHLNKYHTEAGRPSCIGLAASHTPGGGIGSIWAISGKERHYDSCGRKDDLGLVRKGDDPSASLQQCATLCGREAYRCCVADALASSGLCCGWCRSWQASGARLQAPRILSQRGELGTAACSTLACPPATSLNIPFRLFGCHR